MNNCICSVHYTTFAKTDCIEHRRATETYFTYLLTHNILTYLLTYIFTFFYSILIYSTLFYSILILFYHPQSNGKLYNEYH